MASDLFDMILPTLEHFTIWGYWIAFFAALLETTIVIGLILPGSTIVLLLGTLSARGYMDMGDLIWFAVSGAIIGDNINYYLGKTYGARWLKNGFWLLTAIHVEKAKHFMDHHGAKSVFIGRFIPSVKEIVPFIAGSIQMNFKTFMLWNVLGAIGWGFEWVFAGFVFAKSLNLAEMWLSRAGMVFTVLLVSGLVFTVLRWLVIRRGKQVLTLFSTFGQAIKAMITKNEALCGWLEKHPRMVLFVKTRFDTSRFSGFTLSMLLLAFAYVVVLFAGVVEDLITLEPIIAADIRIANLFIVFRTDSLTSIFTWITMLGKSQVIVVFIAASAAILFLWQRIHFILPLLIAVVGSQAFTFLGKLTFHRPRPEMAIYAEPSFSFPSGHASIAVAFYGFMAYLLIRAVQNWNTKVNIFFSALILILSIGFSRIYLGVHYLSDVWSGYLVGAIWMIAAISLCEWQRDTRTYKTGTGSFNGARFDSILLMLLSAAFYTVFVMTYQIPLAPVPKTRTVDVSNYLDLFTNDQIRYTETIIGRRQEPINVIFFARSDHHLTSALEQAGWQLTDKADLYSFITAVKALILRTPHPQAPIAPSFWNAKPQDMSFSRTMGFNWLENAHHVKIWRSHDLLPDGTMIYVGMVNSNDSFKWYIMPKINPDLDNQREQLLVGLNRAGKVKMFQKDQLVPPLTGVNFTGDPFFSDGKVYVISIR